MLMVMRLAVPPEFPLAVPIQSPAAQAVAVSVPEQLVVPSRLIVAPLFEHASPPEGPVATIGAAGAPPQSRASADLLLGRQRAAADGAIEL